MGPLPHRLALGVAVVLALLPAPRCSLARAASASERITSLARAASDPGLAEWQRDFYRERLERVLGGSAPVRDDVAAPLVASDGQPVWSVIADTPRRQGHTLLLDDATGRLYAFGGKNDLDLYNTVFVLDPDGAREWHSLSPQGPAPPARMAHTAVLDAAHRRMVIYGGTDEDGSYLADVWALNLDGTPAWTDLTPAVDGPSARANHFAVTDTLGGRMILFGGANGGFSSLTDLWSLSLGDAPEWTSMTPGGPWPATLVPAALLVDELRHRLALVGLQTVNYSTSWMVWGLQLDVPSPNWGSWVTPYQNSPSNYSSNLQVFTLDLAGDRLVCASTDYYTYTYSLPLSGSAAQWLITTSSGAVPPARLGRATAYDRGHRRLIVSGGGPGPYSSGRAVCDVAALDLAGLALWTAVAGEPGPRSGHSLAFDASRGIVHMFGGQVDSTGSGYGSSYSNGLWSIASNSGAPAWSPEAASGGPLVPRRGAALAVDPARDRLLLFGGTNGTVMTNEVWQRPLGGGTMWAPVAIGGSLPRQRAEAAMVYDPAGDRLLVYGGYDSGGSGSPAYLDDLWALSLSPTPRWTKLASGGGPAACSGSVLAWDPVNGCAYLVGGRASYSYEPVIRAGEVWKLTFSPATAWHRLSRGLPGPIYANDEQTCAAFYDETRGLLVRVAYEYDYGYDARPPVVSTLAPSADTMWTDLAVGGVPPFQSRDAIGVFDTQGRRLIWFGGFNTNNVGTWALSFGAAPLDVAPGVAGALGPVRVAPNPAHAACAVRFVLPRAGRVRLELLDLSGRRVTTPVTADLPAGSGELALHDLGGLPAGVYFARLTGAIERRARVAIVH